MLPSLYIKNYRNIEELSLNSLGQINLISGKNNTGKSSLLEAIFIYVNKGNVDSIIANLINRKEYYYTRISDPEVLQKNISNLSSLFYNRKFSFGENNKIKISLSESAKSIIIRFVKYKEEEVAEENGRNTIKRTIVDDDYTDNNFLTGLDIKIENSPKLYRLDRRLDIYIQAPNLLPVDNQFIHTNNIDRKINSQLFDKIALSDNEKHIIEALKIIEPNTERIAFVEASKGRERVAVIKLSNSKEVVPLSSMGDGINRILTIILALVNSENGYLLIDEFENGLHYTVQEQLWTIIFKLAKELNIQVFATTHSNDCISSFSQVLKKSENRELGKYIRLDNIDGKIKQVEFSAEELDIAGQQEIEIR